MKWLLLLLASACAMPSKTEGFCLPKRITPMLGAIFLLGFAATSRAEVERIPMSVPCKEVNGVSVCLIPEAALDGLLAFNNKAGEQLMEAEKRIAELEAKGPQCGKLEVVPKKVIPPIKPLNNP